MSIKSDIQGIKPAAGNNIQQVTQVYNSDFDKLKSALLALLDAFTFDETKNSIDLTTILGTTITADKFNLSGINNNNESLFSADEVGNVKANSIVSRNDVKGGKLFLDMLNAPSDNSTHGQLIYGVIDGKLDFWGNVNGLGWVSLTGLSSLPSIPDLSQIKWTGSVISMLSAPPATPTRYGRYLIDWNSPPTGAWDGHKGEIAEYNFDAHSWSFRKPEDGTIIVNEADYNKVYVASVSGTVYTWSIKTMPSVIGPDAGNNIPPYQNGLYSDFTEATPVGTPIDRFNQDFFRLYPYSITAFNQMQGKSTTSTNNRDYNEVYPATTNVPVSSIFVSDIPSDPAVATAGDEPVAILIDAPLMSINGSSYYAAWPNPLPANAPSSAIAGARITGIISPEFGESYRAKLFAVGDIEILKDDSRGWFLQYNSGILFQTKQMTPEPLYVKVYVYVGEYLSSSLTNVFKMTTANKKMFVSSNITSNYANTGLRIAETPRKDSYIRIYVNGIGRNLGNGVKTEECYFSSDNTGVTARNLNDISLGDYFFWNTLIADNRELHTDDQIDFDYLTPTDQYQAVPSENIATKKDYVVGAGNSVSAGDFVNLYNLNALDSTMHVRRADDTLSRMAHGYVEKDATAGDNVTVLFDGMNSKLDLSSLSLNVDTDKCIFLAANGKVSSVRKYDTGTISQALGHWAGNNDIIVEIEEEIVNS